MFCFSCVFPAAAAAVPAPVAVVLLLRLTYLNFMFISPCLVIEEYETVVGRLDVLSDRTYRFY